MNNQTPMIKQYLEVKEKHPMPSSFTAWAIFMKCFLKTPRSHQKY